MSFFGSLLFLASLVSMVLIPVYFGRGLAEGDTNRMLFSLVFVALAAVFVALFSFSQRGRKAKQAEH
jgi:hypothetical protein